MEYETIFDYNPTEEELDYMFGEKSEYEKNPDDEFWAFNYSLRQKENYLKNNEEGAPSKEAMKDAALIEIVKLIAWRGDEKKVRELIELFHDRRITQNYYNLLGDF
ncbi:MAG: hypothetical protein LBD45_01485 [Bacteroidales bacterium]|jgi:hypothetical protein|nr:hypothetical protein [Bacteroidales bacterium]